MGDVCNVLVVEDHDAVRATLGQVVEHEGYRFTLVANALEARRAVEREGFDVAIVDVTLPGNEDGVLLADHLAGLGIAILLISGDPAQLERIGRSRHMLLEKPFRLSELKDSLGKLLERSGTDCSPEVVRRGL